MSRAPVLCNQLFDSFREARTAPTGDIDLVACRSCAMMWNAAFEESLVVYSAAYENSLHFSPRFQVYATDLAFELVERHRLVGRTVVEIGSGKGDFLALLCDAGIGAGIGYDPSYAGETPSRPELRFVPTLLPEEPVLKADLICARHVLEHLATPRPVLAGLREALPSDRATALYVEVPDGMYLLEAVSLWDVIYEHPLHFTAGAMVRLLGDAGFVVTRVSSVFGGQYLSAEATVGGSGGQRSADVAAVDVAAVDVAAVDVAALVEEFGSRVADVRARWTDLLTSSFDDGRTVVLWGGGSKGVSFLNGLPVAADVSAIVDVNPRKHGRFVPGTGHQVVSPDDLGRLQPDVVVLLNPIYRDEVQAMLSEAGSRAELVTDPSG